MINLLLLIVLNHTLTPGAIRPLSVVAICSTRWGIDVRHVSSKLKSQVFKSYGIQDHHGYIIDHLIPRELGGADTFENLWPQLVSDAHVKDIQENALHKAVCNKTITLKEAQQRMRWWK